MELLISHVVPIVGMLCGQTISGIVVAVGYVLKELQCVRPEALQAAPVRYQTDLSQCRENRDKTEIYLAFGATRMEACRPIVVQALKLALTPPINSMR